MSAKPLPDDVCQFLRLVATIMRRIDEDNHKSGKL